MLPFDFIKIKSNLITRIKHPKRSIKLALDEISFEIWIPNDASPGIPCLSFYIKWDPNEAIPANNIAQKVM